ncbi:MAG: hypothetical protein SPL69_08170 [Succinivibrionaceae bacterium]|nr:hypothetical protein [Succinivibrionaceae bacterium]MDY6335622.1 hypothetical protein [Succinivibrionaceae bacterium]MDY6376070.1 hypothetical protein [Succinivibrionaceae bacterium]
MMSERDAAMADEQAGKKSGALSGRQCHDVSPAVNATGSTAAERIRESPEMPPFSPEALSAIDEARRISRDPGARGYSTMEELRAALLS